MAPPGYFHSGSRCASQFSATNFASKQDSQIEILYSLPDARIVEFKPSNINSYHLSINENIAAQVEPGTLPWASRFERTIAVGLLHIYRAPGSVAFLNCQNSIRPILPKSQAWCVDGISKIVLRSPPLFWRIEIPSTSLIEVQRAQELKQVLSQILRFDKTPCPFKKDVSVESSGSQQLSPTKKKKISVQLVKPELSKNSAKTEILENLQSEIVIRKLPSKVSRSHLKSETSCVSTAQSHGGCKTSDSDSWISISQLHRGHETSDSDSWISISQSINNPSQLSVHNLRIHEKLNPAEDAIKHFDPVSALYLDRFDENLIDKINHNSSVLPEYVSTKNLENQWELHDSTSRTCGESDTRSNLTVTVNSPLRISSEDDSGSEISSSESFHSFQSCYSLIEPPSSLSKSASQLGISPYSCLKGKLIFSNYSNHTRCTSEQNIEPVTPEMWEKNQMRANLRGSSSLPKTPALSDDRSDKSDEECPEISTPPSSKLLHLHRKIPVDEFRRRKFPPVPSIISQQMLRIAHQIPTSIVLKTIEVLLSPPSNILHSMLRIASRITAGEWRGVFSSYGETIHWDFEDDYRENYEYEGDYEPFVSVVKR